ncbi:hypothetical protein [Modestobacter versicolor]|uniref:hypothetical protein n=1 Tax=Modestobacter versicolor TaxID=429133 RepID=UPI0034DE9D55
MTDRLAPLAAAALVLLGPLCSGCASDGGGNGPAAPAAALPSSAAELEELVVDDVPSGLPQVPDDELDPPAGEKTVDDVAHYGEDAAEQRAVLTDYGYLRGWERFWRSGNGLTTVFLDQFREPPGAATYAEDLARNDAEHYGGELDRDPGDLPDGCVLMVRDEPAPEQGLSGPAAFAWCAADSFTVAVAAVADTPADARAEVTAVTGDQLEQLPG